jgi:hypothetical protein
MQSSAEALAKFSSGMRFSLAHRFEWRAIRHKVLLS